MKQTIDAEYIKVLRLKLILKCIYTTAPILVAVAIILGLFGFDYYYETIIIGLQIAFYILLGLLIVIPLLCFIVASAWAVKWFENYSFELEDTGIRINVGVITKRQKFIPYNKIQNLELVRGFLERRYGLSTIEIQTAGYTGVPRGPFSRPEGEIPGIRDPEPIIDEIRALMAKTS